MLFLEIAESVVIDETAMYHFVQKVDLVPTDYM